MKEIWLKIPEYDDYIISNYGIIKSMKFNKERTLKQRLHKDRFNVGLSKNNIVKVFEVHQLMGIVFLGHVPNKHLELIVDHKDNNPLNNKLDNLQLITHRQNCSKDRITKSGYTGVTFYKPMKKWRSRIRINGKLKHLGYFDNILDANEKYESILKTIN